VEDDPVPFDAEHPEFTETGATRPAPGKLGPKRNVLFVCSRNQWRSPTAERVWQSHPLLSVRSAGTSPSARRRVSAADIAWAEVILVMEEKHRARLLADYAELLGGKTLHVLGIPDEYRYMDPELVDELTGAVAAILGLE